MVNLTVGGRRVLGLRAAGSKGAGWRMSHLAFKSATFFPSVTSASHIPVYRWIRRWVFVEGSSSGEEGDPAGVLSEESLQEGSP